MLCIKDGLVIRVRGDGTVTRKKKLSTDVVQDEKAVIQVNKRMEEDLLDIIKRYNEMYPEEAVEPNRQCSRCKKTKPLTKYYKSRNPIMHNKRIGICRDCIEETVNFLDFGEAQYFLTLMHAPFVEDAWISVSQEDYPVGQYMKMMNLGQYKNLEPAMIHRIKSHSKAFDADPYQAKLDMLTEDERGYLQGKWGYTYSLIDCVKLEDYAERMMEDFEITTRAHQDYLKMIIKTSLAMERALDEKDYDNAKKLGKLYDDLMKSANFAESKSKDKKYDDNFNAFGVIFEMAEKGDFIPQYHNEEDPDIVDRTIKNLKSWTQNLIRGEADLDILMENAAKRVIEQEKKEKEEYDYIGIEGMEDEGG